MPPQQAELKFGCKFNMALSARRLCFIDFEFACPFDDLSRFLACTIFDRPIPEIVHDSMQIFIDMLKSKFSFMNQVYVIRTIPSQEFL